MQPFFILIGQIFLIAVLHSVLEVFVQTDGNPYMEKIISLACYLGSLYLILNFIFEHIFSELSTVINLGF